MPIRPHLKYLSSLCLAAAPIEAKSPKSKEKSNTLMMKPSNLPLYEEPKDLYNYEYHGKDASKIEGGVSLVRKELQSAYELTKETRDSVKNFYETGKAHTLITLDAKPGTPLGKATVDYVLEEENVAAKAGVITVSGLLGLLIGGRRKGLLKKLFYTTLGATGGAAAVYPKDAAKISQELYENAGDYSVIAYNFIAGVKPQTDNASVVPPKETSTKSNVPVSSPPPEVSNSLADHSFDYLVQQSSDVMLWGFRLFDKHDVSNHLHEGKIREEEYLDPSKGSSLSSSTALESMSSAPGSAKLSFENTDARFQTSDSLSEFKNLQSNPQYSNLHSNPKVSDLYLNPEVNNLRSNPKVNDQSNPEVNNLQSNPEVNNLQSNPEVNNLHSNLKVNDQSNTEINNFHSNPEINNLHSNPNVNYQSNPEVSNLQSDHESFEYHDTVLPQVGNRNGTQYLPGNDHGAIDAAIFSSENKLKEPLMSLPLKAEKEMEVKVEVSIKSEENLKHVDDVADLLIGSVLDMKIPVVRDETEEDQSLESSQTFATNLGTNKPSKEMEKEANDSSPIEAFADRLIDSMLNIRMVAVDEENPVEEVSETEDSVPPESLNDEESLTSSNDSNLDSKNLFFASLKDKVRNFLRLKTNEAVDETEEIDIEEMDRKFHNDSNKDVAEEILSESSLELNEEDQSCVPHGSDSLKESKGPSSYRKTPVASGEKQNSKDIIMKMSEIAAAPQKIKGDIGQSNPEDKDMYTTRG